MKKIVADCFNCENMLFLGNTPEGVCICLKHRIQIEPNPGLHCLSWKKGGNFRDCLDANVTVDRTIEEDDQSIHHKE